MKVKNLILSIGIASLMLGCATTTTTVIPNADGSYTMQATDSTEADALNGGIKAATDSCKQQMKSLAVLSHTTKYNGGELDHDTKSTINGLSTLAQNLDGKGATKPMDTSKDYTVTIKYKCK